MDETVEPERIPEDDREIVLRALRLDLEKLATPILREWATITKRLASVPRFQHSPPCPDGGSGRTDARTTPRHPPPRA